MVYIQKQTDYQEFAISKRQWYFKLQWIKMSITFFFFIICDKYNMYRAEKKKQWIIQLRWISTSLREFTVTWKYCLPSQRVLLPFKSRDSYISKTISFQLGWPPFETGVKTLEYSPFEVYSFTLRGWLKGTKIHFQGNKPCQDGVFPFWKRVYSIRKEFSL